MSRSRRELAPLDPVPDARTLRRVSRTIAVEAMAARRLAIERRLAAGVVGEVGRWMRPVLGAAAVTLLCAIPVLGRPRHPRPCACAAAALSASAIEWVATGHTPSALEVFAAASDAGSRVEPGR